jgi:hypothetical protein
MAVTGLTEQVRAWALEEAAKHALGEDYGVDVSWSPQPAQTPQGVQMMPGWLLLITARSPLLGQSIYHMAPIGVTVPDEAAVRAEVAKGVKALRELAAAQLADRNGGARAPLIPRRG